MCVLIVPGAGRAEDPAELKQQGYVNDFAGVISGADSSRMRDICRTLEEHTGDRMLVVTVTSTGSIPPGEFAEQLRKSWIGEADIRERTLVIVVSGQGKMGFGTGSTLDKILTDAKFNAAVNGARAVAGSYNGPKLVYLVQQFANDLDQAGSPSPSPPMPAAPAGKEVGPVTRGSGAQPGGNANSLKSRTWLFGVLIFFLVFTLSILRSRGPLFTKVGGLLIVGLAVTAFLFSWETGRDFRSMPPWLFGVLVGLILVGLIVSRTIHGRGR